MFWAFVRMGFVDLIAYRLRYYTGIITYFLSVSVNYFIWTAVYGTGEGRLEGFSLGEMITYVAVGWVIRTFYHNDIDWDMADQVREGHLAMDLMKPIPYFRTRLAIAAGGSLFRLLCFTPPVALVIFFVFPVAPPAGMGAACLFALSCLMSFLLFVGINFLVGVASIHLKSIIGVIRAKQFVVLLFSGLLIPPVFFPEPVRILAEFLPFQGMSYTPLLFYLGKVGTAEALARLLHQGCWVAILYLLGRAAWNASVKHISIQGG
jgi:ABC-2 type transport system permease protein